MTARYGKKGVKRGLTAGGRGEKVWTYVSKRGSTGVTHATPEKPRTDYVIRTVNGRKTKLFVYRCKRCRMYFWAREAFLPGNNAFCYECNGSVRKVDPALRFLTDAELQGYGKYLAANGVRIISPSAQ